jgi:endonuclease/exonuclease/phosphatase family metal-dependent hydrolase
VTPAGELDVIGVCIPWSGAHVTTGRKDKTRWQDHMDYLRGLARIIPQAPRRLIVAGDFNQTIPFTRAPTSAYDALHECILSRLRVPTSGMLKPLGKPAIDHVAHSSDLNAERVLSLSNVSARDSFLSDHFGVCVQVSAAEHYPGIPLKLL